MSSSLEIQLLATDYHKFTGIRLNLTP
jgi:hypothetical protein